MVHDIINIITVRGWLCGAIGKYVKADKSRLFSCVDSRTACATVQRSVPGEVVIS